MYVGVCYVPSLSKEKLFVDEAYVAEAYVAVNTRVLEFVSSVRCSCRRRAGSACVAGGFVATACSCFHLISLVDQLKES